MSTGRTPRPYVDEVKLDKDLMQTVPFDTMDIGARRSGMPKETVNGLKGLDHVGGTTGKK